MVGSVWLTKDCFFIRTCFFYILLIFSSVRLYLFINDGMKIETNVLENLILIEKLSYQKIGEMFNCSGSNIKKVAQRRGIKLESRRKKNTSETFNKGTGKKIFCLNCGKEITHKDKNKYCNVECGNLYRSMKKYEYFLTNPKEFQRANFNVKWVKKIILREQNYKCDICRTDNIWNGKELVLVIDHIDGDASNNTRENLRCVCPNCDSQLETFKSKNKNSSRHYIRYGGVSQQSSKL